MMLSKQKQKRFNYTLNFLERHVSKADEITDLGEENELSMFLKQEGYTITNTEGDLDLGYEINTPVIFSFEIFEHMFAPFNILNANKGRLVASIPLNVWFAREYWNYKDDLDCHYHEFTIRQFNHLLRRTGWVIKDSKKKSFFTLGIKPLLRLIWPSYYFVYAEKG